MLLPTKIGEKLIAHHFDAKLASLKHQQGIEFGRMQAELDHVKDRGIRSNRTGISGGNCGLGSLRRGISGHTTLRYAIYVLP
jgi:hypothetical protein